MQKTDYNLVAQDFHEFQSITDWEFGYKPALRLLEPLQGKRILDFGCGTGRVAKHLVSEGAQVIGIDPAFNMVRIAAKQKINQGNFVCANTAYGIRKESFDAAVLLLVLCCIDSMDTIIEELRSVAASLKPGASVVILDNHPRAPGHEFLTFKVPYVPEPESGAPYSVILKAEKEIEVIDHFWSIHDYEWVLHEAGFELDTILEPMAHESDTRLPWIDEFKVPPYAILKGVKPW